MAEDSEFRALIATMERQRTQGADANDVWRSESTDRHGAFFAEAQAMIDDVRQENALRREHLDAPLSNSYARAEVWPDVVDILERLFPDEMEQLHPTWYGIEEEGQGQDARAMESPEARQAREYDAWELSDEGIAAQDQEIARWAAAHSDRPTEDLAHQLDVVRKGYDVETLTDETYEAWEAEQETAIPPTVREAIQRIQARHQATQGHTHEREQGWGY